MRDEVRLHVASADAVVMAAAVADFRPARAADSKLKKEAGPPALQLEPTPDILAELGDAGRPAVLVGFAAETDDVEESGRRKLKDKRVDLVVANEVGRPGTGFGADANRAAILSADGDDVPLRDWSKRELAAAICDRIGARLASR
jgi:phosphopantothenoylcysteine decarboxylase/phosphopantothenate--cysteine ligase